MSALDIHADLLEVAMKVASEPGLLFRAPETNDRHDYHPNWDYEINENPDPKLARLATDAAKGIYNNRKTCPFEVWAVDLNTARDVDAIAIYVHGTSGFPVILLDLEKHLGYEDQFAKSIYHELKHAVQDAEGRDYDEDDAEDDY
jgi:hypothetical protein